MRRPWEDFHVGDIIKVKNNNQIPADCLILDIKGTNTQNSDNVAYVKGGPHAHSGETEIKKSCQNTQIKTSGSRLSDSKFV
jgi:magnesium-transporting ATPase (P-type)